MYRKGEQQMTDIIVIGAGLVDVLAALQSADLGARSIRKRK
jgi:predicted oxidoreductase